jgi:hypothetical protein
MKRDRLDFNAVTPNLRDAFWHASIMGPRQCLVPALAHALETAFMAGVLEALGMAQGYPDDDIRGRCLALQRQAADRLAELRETRHDGRLTKIDNANRTVARRTRQYEKRFD